MTICKLIIVAGVASFGFFMSSQAQSKEFDMHYSASELVTKAGAKQVYSRIHLTSEDLCNYELSMLPGAKSQLRFDRCMRRTIKTFIQKVDHPNISKIHYTGTKHSVVKSHADLKSKASHQD